MAITTVLFDLDGTLLPMDQDVFIADYFRRLAGKMAPYGYEPRKLMTMIYQGIKAMVTNDGTQSNEQAFWAVAEAVYGEKVLRDRPHFEEFYRTDFDNIKTVCGFQPRSAEIVRGLKSRGFRVILATNPLFPAQATHWRIQWAGMKPEDFELVTTYDNSSSCKPNPKYYQDILDQFGLKAEECVMVGNDVTEDMIAGTMGMKVFLLTDCMINKDNEDISVYPNGGFTELEMFLKTI